MTFMSGSRKALLAKVGAILSGAELPVWFAITRTPLIKHWVSFKRVIANATETSKLFLDILLYLNLVISKRYDDLEKTTIPLHQHKLGKYLIKNFLKHLLLSKRERDFFTWL